ncbi:MFS transporter [Aquipuribacter nitratireducens]|uniref:MFS transporter n=1 Tax=Aquipuribacter nitratireducens TaxID=650104 RepID=A0ABW0GNA0_9MICO
MSTQEVAPPLRRDAVTAAGYTAVVTWGWFVFASGPVLPLVGLDLGLSKTLVGLHATFLSIGSISSAPLLVPLVRSLRRYGAMTVGAGCVSLAAVLLAVGSLFPGWGLVLTLLGMVSAGFGGTLLIGTSTAVLDGHHGRSSNAAVSEANGLGSGLGLCAPLLVGACVALGLTWRPALLLLLPLAAAGTVLVRRVLDADRAGRLDAAPLRAAPAPARDASGRRTPLPRRVWVILAVVMCGVGSEVSLNTWSAELLRERTVLEEAGASAFVAAFAAGMTVGRFVAVPLARRWTSAALLRAAVVLAGGGFALLWFSTLTSTGWVSLAVVGLAFAGAGAGAFFPIGVAWLVRSTEGQSERGMTFVSVGVGAAAGLVPFGVGALADLVGIHLAMLAIPVGIALVTLGLGVLARARVHD